MRLKDLPSPVSQIWSRLPAELENEKYQFRKLNNKTQTERNTTKQKTVQKTFFKGVAHVKSTRELSQNQRQHAAPLPPSVNSNFAAPCWHLPASPNILSWVTRENLEHWHKGKDEEEKEAGGMHCTSSNSCPGAPQIREVLGRTDNRGSDIRRNDSTVCFLGYSTSQTRAKRGTDWCETTP